MFSGEKQQLWMHTVLEEENIGYDFKFLHKVHFYSLCIGATEVKFAPFCSS